MSIPERAHAFDDGAGTLDLSRCITSTKEAGSGPIDRRTREDHHRECIAWRRRMATDGHTPLPVPSRQRTADEVGTSITVYAGQSSPHGVLPRERPLLIAGKTVPVTGGLRPTAGVAVAERARAPPAQRGVRPPRQINSTHALKFSPLMVIS